MGPNQQAIHYGAKAEIQAGANTGNTSEQHDVGRLSAGPHHVVTADSGGRRHVVILIWTATMFSICLRLYFPPYLILCFVWLPHFVFCLIVLPASLYSVHIGNVCTN